MTFVFANFVIFTLVCLAIGTGSSILHRESQIRDERRSARTAQAGFALLALFGIAVLATVTFTNFWWSLSAIVSMALPASVLLSSGAAVGVLSSVWRPRISPPAAGFPPACMASFWSPRWIARRSGPLPTRGPLALLHSLPSRSMWMRITRNAFAATGGSCRRCLLTSQCWEHRWVPRWRTWSEACVLATLSTPDIVMVFIPRVLSTGVWQRFFVRHSEPRIISALRLEQAVVISEVPYQLEADEEDETRSEFSNSPISLTVESV